MAEIFYLDGFNYDVSAAQGTVTGNATSVPNINYVAEMELEIKYARYMFRFQTNAANVNDVVASDLQYNFRTPVGYSDYNLDSPYTHNPGNAYMSQGELLSINTYLPGILGKDEVRNNQVKHDWTRYLALQLFGSIQATDIMSNEAAVRDSILTGSGTALTAKFDEIVTYQNNYGVGTDPNKVLNANNLMNADAKYKPSKQILDQIFANDLSRLNGVIVDTPELQSVPLIEGDEIAFTMTVAAHADQLTGLGMVGNIPNHTYLVKMKIIADIVV